VTPPIATLPPVTGVMPGLPGGVTPPIATLPPDGLMPTVPGTVTPPIGALAPSAGATRIAAGPDVKCGVGLPARSSAGSEEARAVDCGEADLRSAAPKQADAVVPLTEGRDLVVESLWNGWVDVRHIDSKDRRNGLDLDNSTGGVTLGVDRRVGANAVAGLSLSLDRSDSDAFDGTMTSQTEGFLIGPYVAYRMSDHWAADAAIAVGRYKSDSQLDVLQGNYKADRYTFAVNANGQYEFDRTLVRPRFSVYYAHMNDDDYSLEGSIAGQSISLAMPKTSSNYGMAEASGEVTQSFMLSGGSVVAPYARLAVRYEFARPNDGEVLAGDLSMARTSPWGGSLRLGARALANRATMIEAEAGYLSLGQSDLNIWELRLYVSHAF
jgi:outer membrane autotransporter protein